MSVRKMKAYLSKRSSCGPTVFQRIHAATKTVIAMRKFAVPMNLANDSLHRPKVSCDTVGRGSTARRVSRGRSRREAVSRRVRSAMGHLATLLTPVLRQDVVEHVVHRHRADEPA